MGTIYFYYRSKEEIFAELQEEGLELLYTKIRQSHKDDALPKEKLKNSALALLQFSEECKDYYDIIIYFLNAPEILLSQELKIKVDRHGGKIIAFVCRVVEEGIESGEFKKIHAKRFTIMFWGALQGLLHYKKMKTTLLQGEKFNSLFTYSIDHLIQSISNESF
ncbi:MAG: TetR/AcrR family transcriptional regulator [Desulfobacter sp.]|nr:TetR/AcrR family transcriptional regulator [Desulfobacter sp.]